jgi:archaellum component FlaC
MSIATLGNSRRLAWLLCGIALIASQGCTRTQYRLAADREVFGLVRQKSNDPRWADPTFNPYVNPRSRYFDPFNPDREPMPRDDPASYQFMRYVDGMRGWRGWLNNGVAPTLEAPNWRQRLADYVSFSPSGEIELDLDTAVALAYTNSPDWQDQVETLYLSALDVSTERFRFDVQYYGGTASIFTHNGDRSNAARVIGPGVTGDRNTFTQATDGQFQRRLATGGEILVGFANSFVWQFSGEDSNFAASLANFSIVQPLLRRGGRAVALEQLTIAERALLANLRALAQYRQGFYTSIAMGQNGTAGPQRRGGFFGGTGLTGFTGQGSGGFGGVGQATNFGGLGGAGAGGGVAGTVAGAAGGGAGTVGGFIGLLQQQQQIANIQDSLGLKLRTLGLLEANLDAGLIDITQVDSFRQSIQTDRANLLQAQMGLANQLDTFKRTTLGLPPDLPMVLENQMIQQFQFIDRRMTDVQNWLADFRQQLGMIEGEPTTAQLYDAIKRLAQMRKDMQTLLPAVATDLQLLDERAPQREAELTAEDRTAFRAERQRLANSLRELTARFQDVDQMLAELRDNLNESNRGATADSLVALAGSLGDMVQELSLTQARARLESVVLTPIRITPELAFAVARSNRLDWMNNRASLVDSWRLITFNANALEADLTVAMNGDISTLGDNAARFRAPTGNVQASLQVDPPFTRLLERNNYRSVLITYQQSRRQLIQYQDQVQQTLRQDLRSLQQLEANLALQRSAVAIALRRVDQTREELSAPTAAATPGTTPTSLGPTAAQNLISSLTALSDSQNNFMSVWLNHYATRMVLLRDMGVMRLDDQGRWIDLPLDQLIAEATPPCDLPPDVPVQWLRDAGIDPETLKASPAAEPVPPGKEAPATLKLIPPPAAPQQPLPPPPTANVQRIPDIRFVNKAPAPPNAKK